MRTIRIAALSVTLALCACGQGSPAAARPKSEGPSYPEIVIEVNAALTQRSYTVPLPYAKHWCREFFDIGELKVLDRRVEGTTALVQVETTFTAKKAVGPDTFAGLNCYGMVPGGWRQGQSASLVTTYRFEKWDSGWRLAR